jgi:uncharacterized phosphosugar-binding protein
MNSAERYLDAARHVAGELDLRQIEEAAQLVATALKDGGIIHAFGCGHSALLAQEIFFRAGGLVAVNPVLGVQLGFERGALESTELERRAESADLLLRGRDFRGTDVGFVISNSGRNALPVEVALRMKSAGMKVIALTNLAQSQQAKSHHPSGKRLFEIADAILDNHCPQGDAAVVIEGIPAAVGPLSTIAGAALLHATLLRAAEALAGEGNPPDTFVSVNVGSGSVDDLKKLFARYRDRIGYYRPNGGDTCEKSSPTQRQQEQQGES